MTEASSERFGSYVVYEQLGVGGMASVHRAESRSAGGFRKRVALKRLLPHVATDPELVTSFVHEARLASHLRHANIARVFDFGKVNGTYFIAMEFVAGPTLLQLVRQCIAAAGPIPLPIVVNLLGQICEALDYAHTLCDERGKPLGIIHRDVSPPNVIVSNTGVAKLIDFGLAKVRSRDQTRVGVVKGKFSYIAPEYLGGQLDARADLWAVGVIAHELLTLRRLFDDANDLETVRKVREMPISPPSARRAGIPLELDDIVMTALQRDPSRRWQSAAAMRTSIAGVARQLGKPLSPRKVIDWVEWAFTQKARGDASGLSQLIATLEQPSQPSAETLAPPPAPAPRAPAPPPPLAPAPASLRRKLRTPSRPRAVLPEFRRSRRTGLWLVVLVLLAAAIAAVVAYGPDELWRAVMSL